MIEFIIDNDNQNEQLNPKIIKIKSNTNVWMQSKLIESILEDKETNDNTSLDTSLDTSCESIPLPRQYINLEIFKLLDKFLQHYSKKIFKPISKPITKRTELGEWNQTYLDLPLKTILQLFEAANYLDIKNLRDLIAIKITIDIKNSSKDEVMDLFNTIIK